MFLLTQKYISVVNNGINIFKINIFKISVKKLKKRLYFWKPFLIFLSIYY
jgi:hypothetical protein